MLKQKVLPLIAVALLICFYGCDKKEKDAIRIGCSTPLTGEGANYGRSTKEGIDLAVAEINETNYLGQPFEVIFEDDKMQPRDGVNAVRKLADVDKVPVILGPFGSSIVLACAPIANKTKTVIISASATADSIAQAGDYVFRITPPNSKQGSDIADFCITKLQAKNASILYQNNDYGITLRDAFIKQFEVKGGKISNQEAANLGDTDFRAQLSKIKETKSDVIFFPLHYKEAAIMLKQAKELGVKSRFISADGAMTDDLLKIAGAAADGTYYSTLALGFGVSDNMIDDFTEKFKKKYNGKEPDIYAAYYYEVTKLIAQAIKEAGYNADKIKNYLYSIHGQKCYKGITGITSFDKNGEVNKAFYVYEVIDGKFEICK